MSGTKRFSDEDTHFHIIRSHTPVNMDGYKLGEPIEIECGIYSARAGHVDGINHRLWCPQCELDVDESHGPGFDGTPHF